MNLQELLSTKERVKILKFIIFKTTNLNVNKVANELKLSKGLVSKFFDILVKEKIFIRKKNDFLVQDNINAKAIKILLNLDSFDTKIFHKYKFIQSVNIYGSFVKGENTEESDIDIWILIKKTGEENLAKLTSGLNRLYENIKPLYLTEEKLETLKKEDSVFYYSLIFSSITIYGEKIEA